MSKQATHRVVLREVKTGRDIKVLWGPTTNAQEARTAEIAAIVSHGLTGDPTTGVVRTYSPSYSVPQ